MVAAIRSLHDIIQNGGHVRHPKNYQGVKGNSSRNLMILFKILYDFGLFIDITQKITIISKDFGDFIVNLVNGTINFTPIICIKCNNQQNCKYILRKICIVEESEGWANFAFSKIDLLILSKIFAILYNQLPTHVMKQIKSQSDCYNKKLKVEMLENNIIRELNDCTFPQAPSIQGPIPPPEFTKMHLRFKPPPRQIAHTLDNPTMLKLRSSMLKELRRMHQLIELSKRFVSSPNTS